MAGARKAAVYVTVGEETFAPGDTIPGDVADLIDNPAVWGEEDKGYGDMKVAELKAEIDQRNDGRDPASYIADDGNKADLVAALEADDAAASV